MKKTILFIVAIVLSISTFAQSFTENFEKQLTHKEDFTVVNISAKMFELMAMIADEDLQQIVSDLKSMKILTTGKDASKYYNEAIKLLITHKMYEELMSVQENNETIRMFTQEEKGNISELVVVILEPEEFVLIGFNGKINLREIARIAKMIDIKGVEQLEKITPQNKKQ